MGKFRSYAAKVVRTSRIAYTDDFGTPQEYYHSRRINEPVGTTGTIVFSETDSRRYFIKWKPDVTSAVAPTIMHTESQVESKPQESEGKINLIMEAIDVLDHGLKSQDPRSRLQRQMIDVRQRFESVGVYIDEETSETLALALLRMERGSHFNAWLRGPSGFGKTTIPRKLAELYNKRFILVNCAVISDPEEWFGTRGIENQETVFKLTPLASALRDGNAVILFDEINRAPTWVLNSLLSILDDSKTVTIGDNEITVGDGISFFMTSNEGAQHVGVSELDIALTNRVEAAIVVNELPHDTEVKIAIDRGLDAPHAAFVVGKIRKIREAVNNSEIPVDVSTRVLIKVANQLMDGVSLERACVFSIANCAPIDFRRSVYDIVKSIV